MPLSKSTVFVSLVVPSSYMRAISTLSNHKIRKPNFGNAYTALEFAIHFNLLGILKLVKPGMCGELHHFLSDFL